MASIIPASPSMSRVDADKVCTIDRTSFAAAQCCYQKVAVSCCKSIQINEQDCVFGCINCKLLCECAIGCRTSAAKTYLLCLFVPCAEFDPSVVKTCHSGFCGS